MRVKVFGDSHCGRMFQYYEAKGAGRWPEIEFVPNHGKNTRHFDFAEEGDALRVTADNFHKAEPLDLLLEPGVLNIFSGPLHSSAFSRNRTWRLFCPWEVSDRFGGFKPLSTDEFESLVELHVAASQRLARVCGEKGISLAVIEPPLLKKEACARRNLNTDLVAEVDRRYRASVMRRLARRGADIIPTPPETNDGDFQLPEFTANNPDDAHHGSRSYDMMSVDRVVAYAKSKGAFAA